MLFRFVLHSDLSASRTSELRHRAPAVSLALLDGAARALLAADLPSGAPVTPLLSYADLHDAKVSVLCEKDLKELMHWKIEEHRHTQERAAQSQTTAAEAEDLSASIVLVPHSNEQKDDEIMIHLRVQQDKTSSHADHDDHKQDQSVSEASGVKSQSASSGTTLLPPGGAVVSVSPGAVSGPAVSSAAAALPPQESKDELEYALIDPQGEIEGHVDDQGEEEQPAVEEPAASVISVVKRKMSNPDLPFALIEQQLTQWSQAASSWTAEHVKQGWQMSKEGVQSVRHLSGGLNLHHVVLLLVALGAVLLGGRALRHDPVDVSYSGALVSKQGAMLDPVSSQMFHQLEELQQVVHEMMLREELREYQTRRAMIQAENDAEEERKSQLSERFKTFVEASRHSVENLAEAVGEVAADARQEFATMCDECKEDLASLMRQIAPIRRSLDNKVASVASALRWFRDEAVSYIRYGINVPLRVPALISDLVNQHMMVRLLDPSLHAGENSEENTRMQMEMMRGLRRILREKGIEMD